MCVPRSERPRRRTVSDSHSKAACIVRVIIYIFVQNDRATPSTMAANRVAAFTCARRRRSRRPRAWKKKKWNDLWTRAPRSGHRGEFRRNDVAAPNWFGERNKIIIGLRNALRAFVRFSKIRKIAFGVRFDDVRHKRRDGTTITRKSHRNRTKSVGMTYKKKKIDFVLIFGPKTRDFQFEQVYSENEKSFVCSSLGSVEFLKTRSISVKKLKSQSRR